MLATGGPAGRARAVTGARVRRIASVAGLFKTIMRLFVAMVGSPMTIGLIGRLVSLAVTIIMIGTVVTVGLVAVLFGTALPVAV